MLDFFNFYQNQNLEKWSNIRTKPAKSLNGFSLLGPDIRPFFEDF